MSKNENLIYFLENLKIQEYNILKLLKEPNIYILVKQLKEK